MLFSGYLGFALQNRQLIGFGFIATVASSFGQTFFIGIFGPSVQGEFGLSHTAWGTVYMLGTLASAALLPWSGKKIDTLDLRHYTAAAFVLFVIACSVMANVTGAVGLVFAIFLLRQSGQGLMSHLAITTMARYFERGRGRAIAIASLGFSTGEALLPLAAVLLIGAVGWRSTYGIWAVGALIVFSVACLTLLRGHGERHRAFVRSQTSARGSAALARLSWTRHQVLRDPRFYLMLPGLLTPSVVSTALFFHHLILADAKDWSHAWIAGNYVVFAAAQITTALICGPIVDRLGAPRVVRGMLVPMVLAMLVVSASDNPWVVVPYLVFLGVSSGISHTAVAAMWAEIYGVGHLGAIRSMASALSAFGSALGPVAMGSLLDYGVSTDQICQLFAAMCAAATVLLFMALSGRPRLPPAA